MNATAICFCFEFRILLIRPANRLYSLSKRCMYERLPPPVRLAAEIETSAGLEYDSALVLEGGENVQMRV